jgi:drug/metabolite transporter (DMT)-like permease
MKRRRATWIGFSAIVLWSLLALLTILASPVPPFQLNALTFGIGGAVGLVWTWARGFGVLQGVPLRSYLLGTLGLFGYHALYFTAFRIGPDASTGLMAYLWPLFIVLLSGLLPGERLHMRHILGAGLGLCGAALIMWPFGGGGDVPVLALALAFGCALIWAGYSVAMRMMPQVPTEAVTIYCLATAALSLFAHVAFETTAWPDQPVGWFSIVALGIGPVGVAFFTWDIGMKQGNIQLLGTASYAAPLLSTLALVAFGITQASLNIAVAAVLITAGAAMAAIPKRPT